MNLLTEPEAQLFLARQLPEEIGISATREGSTLNVSRYYRISEGKTVTSREWLHVVSLVETKLTEQQERTYDTLLRAAFGFTWKADYLTRATALAQVLGQRQP